MKSVMRIKINKDKSIGNTVFIVEGGKYEFSLLKHIFCDFLGYDVIEKKRDQDFQLKKTKCKFNKKSIITVTSTKDSNFKFIESHDYIDNIFLELMQEYNIDVYNCAIYYMYDRDRQSNKNQEMIKESIKKYSNPYLNDIDYTHGMLLMSYPYVESFLVSNIENLDEFNYTELKEIYKNRLKAYIGDRKTHYIHNINDSTLEHATNEFIKFLNKENIFDFDIDNFSDTSLEIFNIEENSYEINKYYKIFSMLTLALLQMGIIEIEND